MLHSLKWNANARFARYSQSSAFREQIPGLVRMVRGMLTAQGAFEVLYLAPEPDEPFRQLTLSIWNLFPETPSYSGKGPTLSPTCRWRGLRTNNSSSR